MIAWDRVCELRDEIGADGFAEVIEMFVEDAETLADAITEAGPDDLEAAMHRPVSALRAASPAVGDRGRHTGFALSYIVGIVGVGVVGLESVLSQRQWRR